jgi:hypothetical protein
VSKVGVVFGEAADQVLEFGDNATESMGASKLEALAAAGTFGNLLRAVGLAEGKSAEMSTTMVQLAGDMASFNNVPVAQALDAIRSGLVGETEPLKNFGVNLNEAALKAEAMNLGLSDSKGVLDASAKAQAAYSLIMKATTLQQGDFARTSDSLANQQRTLSAEFANAKAKIGEALLPAMVSLVGAGRDLIPALEGVGSTVADLLGLMGPGISVVGNFLGAFAGSELGTFTLTAAGSAIAIVKIGEAAVKAAAGLKAMSVSAGTLGIAAAGIGLAIGAAVSIFSKIKEDAAAAKEQQDHLAQAFLDTSDPAAVLSDSLSKLNKQLDDTAAKSGTTADEVLKFGDPFKLVNELGPDVIETLNKIGVTGEEITTSLKAGNIAPILNEAREGYRGLHAEMGKGEEADRFTAHTDKAIDSLKALFENSDKTKEGFIENIKVQAQAAEFSGRVSAGWLDQALAASTAKDEVGKYMDVGKQLEGILLGQVGATEDATGATEEKGEADEAAAARAEIAKASQDRLKQAYTEATEATDAAKRAQDEYLLGVVDYPAALDDLTGSVHDLTSGLAEQNEKQVEGAGTFEGNTEAALKNRAAMREITSGAADVINHYDELGYTADQATLAQQALAQSAYEEAIALGAPEAVAARLRDNINGIKPSVTTDVEVTSNAKQIEEDIDQSAANRTTVISVSLQQAGGSQAIWDALHAPGFSAGRAEGGIVKARRGGSLELVGEGGQDEAIVPLGPRFASDLARIVGPRFMGQLDQGAKGGGTTIGDINIHIANAPGNAAEARHLGRLVGESAADVLTHRQLAMAVRVP